MKTKLTILAAMAVVLLPLMASATILTDLTGEGDCNGWSAMASVHWGSATEADLDYTVSILDDDMNVLETFTWAGIVSRDGDVVNQVFSFYDEWTINADAGNFSIMGDFHLVGAYPGGVEHSYLSFTNTFTCDVVSTEAHTWSAVKDLYR